MSKEIYISSTPHETRLAIVEKEELTEIYYERENEYTLAGSIYNGRVTRVLPTPNRAAMPRRAFEVDPSAHIALLRTLRDQAQDGRRERVLGHYHSHPDHPAQWSTTDLAEAHWTGCSYVITSVEHGHAELTHAFLLQGQEEVKSFVDEALEVIA